MRCRRKADFAKFFRDWGLAQKAEVIFTAHAHILHKINGIFHPKIRLMTIVTSATSIFRRQASHAGKKFLPGNKKLATLKVTSTFFKALRTRYTKDFNNDTHRRDGPYGYRAEDILRDGALVLIEVAFLSFYGSFCQAIMREFKLHEENQSLGCLRNLIQPTLFRLVRTLHNATIEL